VAAPVAGRVTARDATIGAIATMASAPMFAITRDGALELRADVAGSDVLKLAPGQKARIRVVGLDAPLTGAIRLVEPTVDAASRLGRVRIAIDEPDRVRVGMFAEVEIEVRAADALAVPLSALGAGGTSVLRVRDGLVEAVPVVAGFRDGGRVQVLEGLAEGDTVVAKAGAFVRDGDHVNPVPAEPAGVTN
jgi:HlyD family secretion protein